MATKGIREAKIATSGPFIESSLAGRKHEADQEIIKSFFRRNPTPARIEIHDDNNVTIPVVSTRAPAENIHPPATANSETLPPLSTHANPPPIFYAQLIETMKSMQAPQQLQKKVVESRNHEESIDLAKL